MNTEWQKNASLLHTFIPSPGLLPLGITLPRPSWVRLNCLHTSTGVDCSTQQCTNGFWVPQQTADVEQTADYILASCPLYIVQPSKWGTWSGSSRWWDCGLVQKGYTEHLMTRSAQTKKNSLAEIVISIHFKLILQSSQLLLALTAKIFKKQMKLGYSVSVGYLATLNQLI